MKKKKAWLLLLTLLVCLLWTVSAMATEYASVYGGWLRLRSQPSYEAPVLASYPTGTVVTVLTRQTGWTRVLTPDYKVGFMDSRYLRSGAWPTSVPQPTATPSSRTWTQVNRTARITSANGREVRLRSSPVVNQTNVLGLYPVGRTVTELRVSNDGWSYIRIDKKHGYMMSQYLTTYRNPTYPSSPTATPRPAVTAVPVYPAYPSYPVYPWYPSATQVPNATYIPLPSPAPASKTITHCTVDPYQPKVGDTIRVQVTPADAEFTVVWYRQEDNAYLSGNSTYMVTDADLGKHIMAHVQGVGASKGYVGDIPSAAVLPAQ